MAELRVESFTISLDGYGAGPEQSLEHPLGRGGEALHEWLVKTRTFQHLIGGKNQGETGIDDDYAAMGMQNIGAWIMGRNMFAPMRGPWRDDSWIGWWGQNPPYHRPVFVLSHYARRPLEMEGGTVFHFVTEGIHAALERARKAAGDQDIRLLGGASTIQQYLREGLVDKLHFVTAPIVLGSGTPLFADIDLVQLGYTVTEHLNTARVTHSVLRKNGDPNT